MFQATPKRPEVEKSQNMTSFSSERAQIDPQKKFWFIEKVDFLMLKKNFRPQKIDFFDRLKFFFEPIRALFDPQLVIFWDLRTPERFEMV